ncbi:MAG TPA: hybrid sensor histidine kinase/response regulator [Bryobacteraceae bacterium]|nr:hybrid sensor histidine kinase/response regulator [Bryobacteraceae bacterium]
MTELFSAGPGSELSASQGDIMIVDDNPANLRLLEDMLLRQGLEVRSFPRGRLALAAAAKSPPSLILLDINMPEMTGYEVCERLKADPRLRDVPVIFLSALNETADKVKALQTGAVDYISKPFQFEEVHARVETHLKLHRLQRELKLHNRHLEAAVAERTRELAEANRRLTLLDRSKNEFLTLISHEFRTPLNGIFGIGDIILDSLESTADNRELKEMFECSRQRILSILDDALLLTEIDLNREQFGSGPVSLRAVVSQALEHAGELARSRGVEVTASLDDADPVLGHERLLVRALHALLEAAVKFSAAGQTVRLSAGKSTELLWVTVESQGYSIPGSELPKFFDLFAISEVSTPGGDLGLGPSMAARVLSLFGAGVSVANREEPGIRFCVSLRPAGEFQTAITQPS